jgi:hypothetical protein
MKGALGSLLAVSLLVVVGCGGGGGDGDGDPCAGQDCSGHGRCVVEDGAAACDCDAGYHAEGLECVADGDDVCAGVDCSGHGVCYDDGGSPACDCDEGYHAEGLDCVAEGYEDWPPALDDLYSAGVGCTLPDCDEDLDAGFQPEGTWTATMTCIESNCSAMIQNTDPRAKPGEVTVEEGIALGQFAGTCGYDDQGVHTATGYDFTVASCEQGEVSMGVTPYQAALMTFDGDTASGTAHIYLTDVPLMAGGDCDFVMEVVYEQE